MNLLIFSKTNNINQYKNNKKASDIIRKIMNLKFLHYIISYEKKVFFE